MGALNSKANSNHDNNAKWPACQDDHFFMNIRSPNTLQFVDIPEDILKKCLDCFGAMIKCMRSIWRPNAYEIELHGFPFNEDSLNSVDTQRVEIAICKFLCILHQQDWHSYCSMNLSPFRDRSTCYFRKNTNHKPAIRNMEDAERAIVLSVSFTTPFICEITCNNDEHLEHICDLIRSAWTTSLNALQIQMKECTLESTDHCTRTLKLSSNLWKCSSIPDSILNRRFLLEIVSTLEADGHLLLTTIDFRSNADTTFFIKYPDRNQPVVTSMYFMLSVNRWDLLRLIEPPKDLVDVTRLIISQNWTQGIECESTGSVWHEFQLKGSPWAARSVDAVQSHAVVTSILQAYLARGWKPVTSLQVSRTFKDRTCIILKRQRPSYRPHMSLGLFDSNELHLINADDELRDYVTALCQARTNDKGKLAKLTLKNGWSFLALRGQPWYTGQMTTINGHAMDAYDYLESRDFIQNLLKSLRIRGWEVVINIDLAARARYKRKSSNGSGRSMSLTEENNIPLDVNSLILANVYGSRHNSYIDANSIPRLS